MITFEEARSLVGGKTLSHGWEDNRDFVVLPEPPEEDLTTMVNKRTRRVHKEVVLRVRERLNKMTRVGTEEIENTRNTMYRGSSR